MFIFTVPQSNFTSALKCLVTKTGLLVRILSFNLIKVREIQQTSDPKEKIIRNLMESKLLFGGIENRFLLTFDKETKEKRIHSLEISND
jgi:hypothetical protein